MVYLLVISTFLFTACVALGYLVFDLTRQRNAAQDELKRVYQAHIDAGMRRLDGHRVFGENPKPQTSGSDFELGTDMVVRQQHEAVLGMSEADVAFLESELGV
jgi:hypothetical protein